MSIPFVIDPSMGREKGDLSGFVDAVLASKKEKEEKQRAEMRKKAISDAFASGDPGQIAKMSLEYPEMSQMLNQQVGIRNKAHAKEASDFAASVLTASPGDAVALYEKRINSLKEQGRDASDTEESLQNYFANPEGENRALEMMLAAGSPEKYKAYTSRWLSDDKDLKLGIELEKLKLRKEESRLRELEYQQKVETNVLKREELGVKIAKGKQKIEQEKKRQRDRNFQSSEELDNALSMVERLMGHPGADRALGLGSAFPTTPGSDAANFEALLETFDSQLFLSAVEKMRGFGQLSNLEGSRISSAVGAIKIGMSREEFFRQIRIIRDIFSRSRERMMEEGTYMGRFGKEEISVDSLVEQYAN